MSIEEKIVCWLSGEGRFNSHAFWKLRLETQTKSFLRIFRKIRYYRVTNKYHSQILLETRIKGEPRFPHGLNGIYISANAAIGENCTIFHQVTIGSNEIETSKTYGAPVIGNNVYIGVGAKIIGGITVGNNVNIGANCIVVTDIPDDTTVVIDKPRVIYHKR